MRCKHTGRPLKAIWRHPELDGQWVAAYTRFEAWALVKAVTMKDLEKELFVRTGDFAYSGCIISTLETYDKVKVKQ